MKKEHSATFVSKERWSQSESCEFLIVKGPELRALFNEAVRFGVLFGTKSDPCDSSFSIRAESSFNGLTLFFQFLKDRGYEPVENLQHAPYKTNEFRVYIENVFSEIDIESANYFRLISAGQGLANVIERSTERLVLDSDNFWSETDGIDPEQLDVIGTMYGGEFAVSHRFMERMKLLSFVGARFNRLKWSQPNIWPNTEFFAVGSSFTMPSSLCRVVNLDNSELSETLDLVEPDNSRNARLIYRREDFLKLGAFEIAEAIEKLGIRDNPSISERIFVISQRFRQFLLANNISHSVTPVELVD